VACWLIYLCCKDSLGDGAIVPKHVGVDTCLKWCITECICWTVYWLKQQGLPYCLLPNKSVCVNLTLHTFCTTNTYRQVHHQQIALIPKYRSTPTCFGYYQQPSSGSINAKRHGIVIQLFRL